jgi:hypothetical protein
LTFTNVRTGVCQRTRPRNTTQALLWLTPPVYIQIGDDIGVGASVLPAGRAERAGDFEQHPRDTNDVVGSASLPGATGDGLTNRHDGLVIPAEVGSNFQQSLAQLTCGCTFRTFQLSVRRHLLFLFVLVGCFQFVLTLHVQAVALGAAENGAAPAAVGQRRARELMTAGLGSKAQIQAGEDKGTVTVDVTVQLQPLTPLSDWLGLTTVHARGRATREVFRLGGGAIP